MTAAASEQTPAVTATPKSAVRLKSISDFAIMAIFLLGVVTVVLEFVGFRTALTATSFDVGDVVFGCTLILAGFGALFTAILLVVLAPRSTITR